MPAPRPSSRTRRTPARQRRRFLALAALLAAVAAVAAIAATVLGGGAPAREALEGYATAWSRGDDRAAAALTDRVAEARRALTASRRGLDGARVRATVGDVTEDGDRASARLAVAWEVPRIGTWRYRTRLVARRAGDAWQVVWRPANVHPRLERSTRLGTIREPRPRGSILDRRGRALVTDREVMQVAVEVAKVDDPGATAARVAALTDVDERRLERAIRRAPRGRFVPVVTLRRTDYDRMARELETVPGISLAAGTAPLAPTKGFARALLGTVAPATAEQIERAGGRLQAGQEIGQWGLQATFEERLAGTADRAIVIRRRSDGAVVRTLRRLPGRSSRSVRTTLDLGLQRTAERALGDTAGKAALVALQPSTGDILAVANRPTSSALNRAFTGLYPPGSTFKVVSTAALLRDGLSVDETVGCPRTRNVGGRAFRNFEGSAQGAVPFRTDFSESCNTAFVALADRLSDDALTRVARDYGIGRKVTLALPAADGRVPAPRDAVSHAAMMIGQDRILASPLTMAGVAATVAAGRWRAPRLLRTDRRVAGGPLPGGEVQTLRELMRAVVTTGTGEALAGLPGEVAGKSGTAEYGGGDPPPTHAWFIAYRDDIAVAVLVEGGRSGGEVAAPVAQRFFEALP